MKYNGNLAYGNIQTFDDLNNQNLKKQRKPKPKVFSTVLTIVFALSCCMAVVFMEVELSQGRKEIMTLNSDLNVLQNQNTKIVLDIERASNLGSIKDRAVNDLGMTVPGKEQITYVDITENEYIESSNGADDAEIEQKDFLENISDAIDSFFGIFKK